MRHPFHPDSVWKRNTIATMDMFSIVHFPIAQKNFVGIAVTVYVNKRHQALTRWLTACVIATKAECGQAYRRP